MAALKGTQHHVSAERMSMKEQVGRIDIQRPITQCVKQILEALQHTVRRPRISLGGGAVDKGLKKQHIPAPVGKDLCAVTRVGRP